MAGGVVTSPARPARTEKPPAPRPTEVAAPPVRRVTRRLPWEDQPDNYDRGLDRLMREVPGGR